MRIGCLPASERSVVSRRTSLGILFANSERNPCSFHFGSSYLLCWAQHPPYFYLLGSLQKFGILPFRLFFSCLLDSQVCSSGETWEPSALAPVRSMRQMYFSASLKWGHIGFLEHFQFDLWKLSPFEPIFSYRHFGSRTLRVWYLLLNPKAPSLNLDRGSKSSVPCTAWGSGISCQSSNFT